MSLPAVSSVAATSAAQPEPLLSSEECLLEIEKCFQQQRDILQVYQNKKRAEMRTTQTAPAVQEQAPTSTCCGIFAKLFKRS
jgi:hypothetical protein